MMSRLRFTALIYIFVVTGLTRFGAIQKYLIFAPTFSARISGRRSSALDSGASRVETPPAANGFVNSIFDASSDGRGSDSSKSSKSVVDRVKNAVFQDEEWSDLDESLFVIKATQAEEEIQS